MTALPDGRSVLLAPDDDVRSAILAMLNGAQHEILLQMYALTLVPAVDALIAKHQAGVDVALVLDQSQSGETLDVSDPTEGYLFRARRALMHEEAIQESALGGSPERVQVERLKSAGVPMVIGNSASGSILHEKAVVVDTDIVAYGSYNWSLSAQLQTNCWTQETNAAVAAIFRAAFLANWIRLGGTPRS